MRRGSLHRDRLSGARKLPGRFFDLFSKVVKSRENQWTVTKHRPRENRESHTRPPTAFSRPAQVTGAAHGIGRAVAEALLARGGALVFACDLDSEAELWYHVHGVHELRSVLARPATLFRELFSGTCRAV